MTDGSSPVLTLHDMGSVSTLPQLAALLRGLRRRQARSRNGPELTYRELSARTGWSVGLIAGYFGGRILPPTDRFDDLVMQLDASLVERGALASARDRVHEARRQSRPESQVQPASVDPPAAAARPVPRQLPPTAPHLAGRRRQLAELDQVLDVSCEPSAGPSAGPAAGPSAGPSAGPPAGPNAGPSAGQSGGPSAGGTAGGAVAVVSGTAGVGKTALAVHWARRVAGRFPDGQLYVDLRGFDPGGDVLDPADAIRGFLDALGVPAQRLPATPDAQAALYRTLLAGLRVLVVLDNARDADQVRPLLPGATAAAVAVVTSRNRLASLVAAGAQPVALDVMSADEARALLAGRLGSQAVAGNPDAVARIVDACARLPLALSIAAARAQQTGFPLAAIAAELDAAEQRLDALDTGDTCGHILAVFSWSYAVLCPAAARLFRLLCLHPGPDIATSAAAALGGCGPAETRRLLSQLAHANLIAEPAPGRYTLHDLLRAYGASLVAAGPDAAGLDTAGHDTAGHDTASLDAASLDAAAEPAEGRAALGRLFDHYLASATAAIDALYGPDTGSARAPNPEAADGARAWLDVERRCLSAVVAYTATRGWPAHAVRLSQILRRYLISGHAADALVIHGHAEAAARRAGDRAGEAHALRNLGTAHWQTGRHAAGARYMHRAVALFRELGDRAGEADTLGGLGGLEERLGRHTAAVEHLERAMTLCRGLRDTVGEARAMANLGLAEQRLGRPSSTDRLTRALALYRQAGHRTGEAYALCGLGDGEVRLGHLAEAAADFERGAALFRGVGNRVGEAWALDGLGLVATRLGRLDRAFELHRQSLDIFRDVGDRDGDAWALNGLGEAANAAGDPAAALVHHRAALVAGAETGTLDHQARARAGLGRAHEALGDPAAARQYYRQARVLYADLGHPDLDGVEALLAALDEPAPGDATSPGAVDLRDAVSPRARTR